MMTDENQNIVWQATNTPFGKATIVIEAIENNIRFPGQYYDEEVVYITTTSVIMTLKLGDILRVIRLD
jgi:hypothetical protein